MESFTAQKRMKDKCEKYSGARFVPIAPSLLVQMRSANTNYHKQLEKEKKEKEEERKRQRYEEENMERKRKVEEEKQQWEEKTAKLKEDIKIKQGLANAKHESAMEHINNMMIVKDNKILKNLAAATKLEQENAKTLTSQVQELQKKLNKLLTKKPKMSSGGG